MIAVQIVLAIVSLEHVAVVLVGRATDQVAHLAYAMHVAPSPFGDGARALCHGAVAADDHRGQGRSLFDFVSNRAGHGARGVFSGAILEGRRVA